MRVAIVIGFGRLVRVACLVIVSFRSVCKVIVYALFSPVPAATTLVHSIVSTGGFLVEKKPPCSTVAVLRGLWQFLQISDDMYYILSINGLIYEKPKPYRAFPSTSYLSPKTTSTTARQKTVSWIS
jgi:hypothetical protein